MIRKLFVTMTAGSLALFLITACAEDTTATSDATPTTENSAGSGQQDASLMNQPVDFSSPEAVEATMLNIREKEGDQAHTQLKNAMQYIMVYDFSVGNSKQKLYKKLDGRTPEQIIAKMKR